MCSPELLHYSSVFTVYVMDPTSGVAVALKPCSPDVAQSFVSHAVATLLLHVQGAVESLPAAPWRLTHFSDHNSLPRHGHAAVSFSRQVAGSNDDSEVYIMRFSVIHPSAASPPPPPAATTAFVFPALLEFLGHPTAATLFPIKAALPCSSATCCALVTR